MLQQEQLFLETQSDADVEDQCKKEMFALCISDSDLNDFKESGLHHLRNTLSLTIPVVVDESRLANDHYCEDEFFEEHEHEVCIDCLKSYSFEYEDRVIISKMDGVRWIATHKFV